MSKLISVRNLEAALSLSNDVRVFPARPIYNSATNLCNKPPYISNWQTLATSDSHQIERWWQKYSDAIPAICLERLVVIDADRHSDGADGVAALSSLAKSNGQWPEHPVVDTPGNGEHLYFIQPDIALGNGTGQLPPGIDVRGIGGFVIGPGAVLPNGMEWLLRADQSGNVPQLPTWLEQLIRAKRIVVPPNGNTIPQHSSITVREERYADAVLEACADEVATALEGERNTTLNNVAYRLGRMIARGWIDRDKVENCLLFAAFSLKNEDGLAAVLATIRSGMMPDVESHIPILLTRKGTGNECPRRNDVRYFDRD